MVKKIQLLAFAAHPDDVEISASGIMIKHKLNGLTTGIVDLTRGELGTRGSAELRDLESIEASKIMGLDARENLRLKDGFFENNEENAIKVVEAIRKYQPDIVLINAESDRHPDHGRAHELVKRALFLSGLPKIKTVVDGIELMAWRPRNVYSYIQDHFHQPHLVIDVTDVWETRMKALMAYKSQFFDPNSDEPNTPISSPEFIDFLNSRGVHLGRYINSKYAEGLRTVKPIGTDLLSNLI